LKSDSDLACRRQSACDLTHVPTEFVLLTSREDEIYLRAHPGFKRLSRYARRGSFYRPSDHGTNYSTTITLAYTEAIRAPATTCSTPVSCCWFHYIVADDRFAP